MDAVYVPDGTAAPHDAHRRPLAISVAGGGHYPDPWLLARCAQLLAKCCPGVVELLDAQQWEVDTFDVGPAAAFAVAAMGVEFIELEYLQGRSRDSVREYFAKHAHQWVTYETRYARHTGELLNPTAHAMDSVHVFLILAILRWRNQEFSSSIFSLKSALFLWCGFSEHDWASAGDPKQAARLGATHGLLVWMMTEVVTRGMSGRGASPFGLQLYR